jgi:hypothetical protein
MNCGLVGIQNLSDTNNLISTLKEIRPSYGYCIASIADGQLRFLKQYEDLGFKQITPKIPNPVHANKTYSILLCLIFRDEQGKLIPYDWAEEKPKVEQPRSPNGTFAPVNRVVQVEYAPARGRVFAGAPVEKEW